MANPVLWGKITEALDRSGFMIVVLSPRSAVSHWVKQELTYWLHHRGLAQLILGLAEGHLQWDAEESRFDPDVCDASPPVLTKPKVLSAELLCIDVSDGKPWDLSDLAFRDKVTSLAVPIHGKDRDQLAGDEVREQRRCHRLRRAAIAVLSLLTVIAIVAAIFAFVQRGQAITQRQETVRQRQDALRQRDQAIALRLDAEAQLCSPTLFGVVTTSG